MNTASYHVIPNYTRQRARILLFQDTGSDLAGMPQCETCVIPAFYFSSSILSSAMRMNKPFWACRK